VGIIRDILSGGSNALLTDAESGPSFAVTPEDIPAEVFGLTSYVTTGVSTARVTRKEAMSVPAVKRARDLIAGTLGTLPLDVIDPSGQTVPWPVLDQPERDVPRSVTLTRTFEDMLFETDAWWRVTEFGWRGYPYKVKRLDPRRVAVDEDRGVVYVDGKAVPNRELIRFMSPTDALLVAGARAIRTCLMLDQAAARHVDGTPPVDYFTPEEGVDPFDDDDEVKKFLDDWKAARQDRSTAYVPAAVKYNLAGWDPEKLQMAEARNHAVLEIAREAGVDPEELGVSTTSRTYANQFDRRKAFLDFTLGMYRQAFEDRLSMGDVTPRDYQVKQNLSAFLRSDDKTRMETFEIGKRIGRYVTDEIRDIDDAPPLTPAQRREVEAQNTPPAPAIEPLTAHQIEAGRYTFSGEAPLTFDSPTEAQFSVDHERRIIRGLAVPYGQVGRANGRLWQFGQGVIKWPAELRRVKLLVGHDFAQAVGYVFELTETALGLMFAAKVAPGPEGDRALIMADPAQGGVWDGVSIGLGQGGRFDTRGGVNHAVEAPLMEISLTPLPSFTDARVHAVAASAAHTTEGEHDMKLTAEQKARLAALRGKDTLTQAEATELSGLAIQESADAAAEQTAAGGDEGGTQEATFSAITNAIQAGFAGLGSLPTPEEISAAASSQTQVTEPALYRFDGIPGERSLTGDMRAALGGDAVARQHLDEFFNETFAVTTSNTATLNPAQNRPDMYVPNLQFNRPLWDMVTTGNITDRTPFTVPKFASASGLVAPHVEGVEPTPGAFAATVQTINPGAVSGKIEVNREVLDQGGSPQSDTIIWNEMQAAYYEAIELRIAAKLASITTVEENFGSEVGKALISQFKRYLAGLQFVRGGNRFTGLALDGSLFPALIDAQDDVGRSLLPVHAPTNTDGSTTGAFDRIAIGGLSGRAAWALGTGNAAKSYNFVPSSVYAWASPPRRFDFNYQVKSVDIAIWGYGAEAITRDSDVKPLDYTTADA
jgi:HK97 family phage prohead protease